jgi:hypothetical protein
MERAGRLLKMHQQAGDEEFIAAISRQWEKNAIGDTIAINRIRLCWRNRTSGTVTSVASSRKSKTDQEKPGSR